MMLYDFTFFSVLSILIFVLSILSLLLRARLRGRSIASSAVDDRAVSTYCCLQGGADVDRLGSRTAGLCDSRY